MPAWGKIYAATEWMYHSPDGECRHCKKEIGRYKLKIIGYDPIAPLQPLLYRMQEAGLMPGKCDALPAVIFECPLCGAELWFHDHDGPDSTYSEPRE